MPFGSSRFIPIAFVALFVAVGCGSTVSPPATQPALSRFDYHGLKMASDFNLVLYAPDQATADAANAAVGARIDELVAVLSDYEATSEVRRLDALTHDGPMTRPAPVGPDLWNVMDEAKRAYDLSGGAFDVTVGPYVQLWQRARRQQEMPAPERMAEAKAAVGFDKVTLDPAAKTVLLAAKRMRIDTGGIATGYISDECIKVLKQRGIHSALIDLSGDLSAGDPPPGKADWRVAVQSLLRPADTAGYVELHNRGISTSGDTYRYVEIDGVRYSHILDPKTGLGLTRHVGVTAVADDDLTADWLATAVSVLGPAKGIALVESIPGAAARVTTVDGGKVNVAFSSRYREVPAATTRAVE